MQDSIVTEAVPKEFKIQRKTGAPDTLPVGTIQTITVTSGPSGTTICLNGEERTKVRKNFKVSPHPSEQPLMMIVGNSPNGRQYWIGALLRTRRIRQRTKASL